MEPKVTDEKLPAPIPELSVEASLTETGLKGSARSRALVGFDRLLGNLADLFNVRIEAHKREVEAQAAVREMLIQKEGQIAAKKMEALQQVGDRVLDKFLGDEVRRQANQQTVAREALKELKALPPPPEAARDGEELDEDWLNVFSDHAGNATSERLRKVWGRVLAGEIRKPGSFSLTTLRFVSELDREIAETFERHVKTRLPAGFIAKPREMKNDKLLELTFLEEVGLLQDVNGTLGWTLDVGEDGYSNFFVKSPWSSGDLFLRIKMADPRLELIRITRVGREIASILLPPSDEDVLDAVAEQLIPRAESIKLFRLGVSTAPQAYTTEPLRTIK